MLSSGGAKSSSKARPGASAAGRSNIRQHMMQRKKAAEQAGKTNDVEMHISPSSSAQQDSKNPSVTSNEDAKKPASSPRCEDNAPSVTRRASDDDDDNANKDGQQDNATYYNRIAYSGNAGISNGNGSTTSGINNNGISTSGAAMDTLPTTDKAANNGPSPPTSSSSTSSQHSNKSETATQSTNVIANNVNVKFTNPYSNLGIDKAVAATNSNNNNVRAGTKRGLGVASRVADATQSTKRALIYSLRSTTLPKSISNTTTTNKAIGATRIPLTARTSNGAGRCISIDILVY
jgi:hypothetical protein